MKQIYHHYELWEDYKNGFYKNCSGFKKKEKINKVIELFSDSKKTEEMMLRVVDEWTFSCEHNLSNISMNRIAYLGQAACCLYAKVPNIITMKSWNLIDIKKRNKADSIAKLIIKEWEQNQRLLNISKLGKQGDTRMEYQMKLQLF